MGLGRDPPPDAFTPLPRPAWSVDGAPLVGFPAFGRNLLPLLAPGIFEDGIEVAEGHLRTIRPPGQPGLDIAGISHLNCTE
jgi:hypothetical protein